MLDSSPGPATTSSATPRPNSQPHISRRPSSPHHQHGTKSHTPSTSPSPFGELSHSSSPSRLCPADFLTHRPSKFAVGANELEPQEPNTRRNGEKAIPDKRNRSRSSSREEKGTRRALGGAKEARDDENGVDWQGKGMNGRSRSSPITSTRARTEEDAKEPPGVDMLDRARALLCASSSSNPTPPLPASATSQTFSPPLESSYQTDPSQRGQDGEKARIVGLGRAIDALRLVIRGLGMSVRGMQRSDGESEAAQSSERCGAQNGDGSSVTAFLLLISQIQSSHPLAQDAVLHPATLGTNGLPLPSHSSGSSGDGVGPATGHDTKNGDSRVEDGQMQALVSEYEFKERTCGGAIGEIVREVERRLKGAEEDKGHARDDLKLCRVILARVPGKRTRSIKSPPPQAQDNDPMDALFTMKTSTLKHGTPSPSAKPVIPNADHVNGPILQSFTRTHTRQGTATSTRFGSPTSTLDPPTPFHYRLASRASSIFSTTSSLWSTRTGLSRVSKSASCLPQMAEAGVVYGELRGAEERIKANGKGKERASMSAAETMLRRYQAGTIGAGQQTKQRSRLSHAVFSVDEGDSTARPNGANGTARKDPSPRTAKPVPRPIRLDSSHVKAASRMGLESSNDEHDLNIPPESPDIMSPAGRLTAMTSSPVLTSSTSRPAPPAILTSTLTVPLSRSLHATASSPTLNASFKQRMMEQQLSQKHKPGSRAFEGNLLALGPLDPALAAAEAASSLTKHGECGACGKEGVNFPSCRKCGVTFCSRECRIGVKAAGDGKKHICGLIEARRILRPPKPAPPSRKHTAKLKSLTSVREGTAEGGAVGANAGAMGPGVGMERRASVHA